MTQVGPATILQDSLMHQDNQLGTFIDSNNDASFSPTSGDECHLSTDVESVVNDELTLAEAQQLAADLPAIRSALTARGFTIEEDGVPVDRVPNLPAAYQAMWSAVYS